MLKIKNIFVIPIIVTLISGLSAGGAAAQHLEWHSFEKALAATDSSRHHILVDVWAPWCGWCRKLKKEVYPELAPTLKEHFVLTKLNRDDNRTTYRYKGKKLTAMRLAREFQAEAVPTIVLLNGNGEYLTHISGYLESEDLKPVLLYIASHAYKHETFKAFKNQHP